MAPYRRITLAVGVSMFVDASLYLAVLPLLPRYADQFHLDTRRLSARPRHPRRLLRQPDPAALQRNDVVPTGVGVNRPESWSHRRSSRCPHGRGGEPRMAATLDDSTPLSPRAWG